MFIKKDHNEHKEIPSVPVRAGTKYTKYRLEIKTPLCPLCILSVHRVTYYF